MELTSSQKGGLAELKIAAEAAALGIDVHRPMIDGARCDLIFDTGARLLRVQCKWATRVDDVVAIPLRTSRHTASRGYIRTTYRAAEIDGIAAYCRELDRCFSCRSRSSSVEQRRDYGWLPRGTVSSSVLRWPVITRLGL
jgi:hypothetical protein